MFHTVGWRICQAIANKKGTRNHLGQKKVMPHFVRESKKPKSCGSKRHKPTHADTHSQPLNDKS